MFWTMDDVAISSKGENVSWSSCVFERRWALHYASQKSIITPSNLLVDYKSAPNLSGVL